MEISSRRMTPVANVFQGNFKDSIDEGEAQLPTYLTVNAKHNLCSSLPQFFFAQSVTANDTDSLAWNFFGHLSIHLLGRRRTRSPTQQILLNNKNPINCPSVRVDLRVVNSFNAKAKKNFTTENDARAI